MTDKTASANPTLEIDVSFGEYVNKRKAAIGSHIVDGIPDYAYGIDHILRGKIKNIPFAYDFFKTLTNTYVPKTIQECNSKNLRVSQSQYSEIYEMVVDCARRLGIGIPTIFVDVEEGMNSCTIACEDSAPIIVLGAALIRRLTPSELKTVIGHECGHIHNNHGIYTIAVEFVLHQFISKLSIVKLASRPLRMLLNTWSRAAEVTADRSGLICADNLNDAIDAQCKLMTGGAHDVDVESLLKQWESLRATPVKLLELDDTHPAPVRRILAIKEFMNCDVLYKWRPDFKKPDMKLIDKQELDARCEKYIGITKNEKKEG